jgi:aryl-alcohol dehydrogenase-like predicted oxidoreductase
VSAPRRPVLVPAIASPRVAEPLTHGLSAFPFISQAGGYFRRLEQGTLDQLPMDNRIRRMFDDQENRERFQRMQRLQQKTGLSVGQIVLGYLTNQPFPVFPLIGPKTLPDLQESLRSAGAKHRDLPIMHIEAQIQNPIDMFDQTCCADTVA